MLQGRMPQRCVAAVPPPPPQLLRRPLLPLRPRAASAAAPPSAAAACCGVPRAASSSVSSSSSSSDQCRSCIAARAASGSATSTSGRWAPQHAVPVLPRRAPRPARRACAAAAASSPFSSSSISSSSVSNSSSSQQQPGLQQQQHHPQQLFSAPRSRRAPAPPPRATFAASGGDDELLDRSSEFVEATTGWRRRWTVVLLCFVAFMLCNMDRVNMSVAVLPMSQQFAWDSKTVGLVQSSFFWCARARGRRCAAGIVVAPLARCCLHDWPAACCPLPSSDFPIHASHPHNPITTQPDTTNKQGLPAHAGARRHLGRPLRRQAGARPRRRLVVARDGAHAARRAGRPAAAARRARAHGHRRGRRDAGDEQHALALGARRRAQPQPRARLLGHVHRLDSRTGALAAHDRRFGVAVRLLRVWLLGRRVVRRVGRDGGVDAARRPEALGGGEGALRRAAPRRAGGAGVFERVERGPFEKGAAVPRALVVVCRRRRLQPLRLSTALALLL